ncbi:MAG: hypothetical protein QOI66_3528, partial [Myxococcales bacterium]|nr:hypothetical protein [Myxococcales bacterium]
TYGWAVTNGAYSLSPDVLVGYHQTEEWAGPWSHAPAIDLQWNGGGSYYGCWD